MIYIRDLKAGDVIIAADDKSECLHAGREYVVRGTASGLYVKCDQSPHYIDYGPHVGADGELLGFAHKEAAR